MNQEEMMRFGEAPQQALSSAFPVLMRKVYIWMALALVITGVTAYSIASSPAALEKIYSGSGIMLLLIVVELGLVFAISAGINRFSLTTATLLFTLYSVVNGMTLSYIFLAYTESSIASVFFITAGTFAAMALFGYLTKTDLSSMGKLLFMLLIGIIIATIVNFFMRNSMLDMLISYAGVAIFVGLTAYDTQKIKQMLMTAPDAGEHMQKLSLIGALTLYLDFINLFLYLLRIFGNNRK